MSKQLKDFLLPILGFVTVWIGTFIFSKWR